MVVVGEMESDLEEEEVSDLEVTVKDHLHMIHRT